jgi:hypothetical protein
MLKATACLVAALVLVALGMGLGREPPKIDLSLYSDLGWRRAQLDALPRLVQGKRGRFVHDGYRPRLGWIRLRPVDRNPGRHHRGSVSKVADEAAVHARRMPHRRVAARTPLTTTSRDFGERFVPNYTRPSMVDLLLNAPFKE